MRLLLLLSFSLLLVAGCAQQMNGGNNQTSTTEPKTFKVGVILPLTGTLANVGAGMKDSVNLAAEDANKNGGVNGKQVELVFEDTACDPAKVVPALNKLITVDKINALVGPTCSGESLAAASILDQNKIPAVSPSASQADLTAKGGNYFFRVVPSDSLQEKLAVKYINEKLGSKKVAILFMNNDWGLGLKDSFKAAFQPGGGQVVAEESFDAGATDMRTQITKLLSSEPDLVYLPCYPSECAVALQQLSEAGYTGKIMGADGADDATTLKTIGTAADGLIITVASGPNDSFNDKFKARYGRDGSVYTAQTYDSLMLLVNAAKGGISGPAMKDSLYDTFHY